MSLVSIFPTPLVQLVEIFELNEFAWCSLEGFCELFGYLWGHYGCFAAYKFVVFIE